MATLEQRQRIHATGNIVGTVHMKSGGSKDIQIDPSRVSDLQFTKNVIWCFKTIDDTELIIAGDNIAYMEVEIR